MRSTALAALWGFVAFPAHAADIAFFEDDGGASNPRGVFDLDTTGPNFNLRTSVAGGPRFFGLAIRPTDGVCFAADPDPSNSEIYTLDLTTGAFALQSTNGLADIADITFDATGTMYGLGRNTSDLFVIDPATGASTLIGNAAPVRAGITFSPGGVMYGFDVTNGTLYTIDVATAAPTLVGTSGAGVSLVEDATFTAAGELFITDYGGQVVEVDPATGARTLVLNTGMGNGHLGILEPDVPIGPGCPPGTPEIPDGIDNDCNGIVDDTTIWYDDDGDGYAEAGGDCNDADPTISPVATEVCDGIDQDCDGSVDEDTTCTDDDGDGYCEGPGCNDGSLPGDCSDGDASVFPGTTEVPNNDVDDDCDGAIDFGATDADGDGYGDTTDCDDSNPNVHPGAIEFADGLDNDCDGVVDEGTTAFDDDGDGYSEDQGDCNDADANVNADAMEQDNGFDDDCDGSVDEDSNRTDDDGDGYSELDGDCDDADVLVHPGAEEVENSADDDCDNQIDEDFYDLDGDGYTADDGDCDDSDGWVHPAQAELCDGVDNNCDGSVDDGCATVSDGVTEPKSGGCGCSTTGAPSPFLLLLLPLLGRRRR